MGLFVGSRAFHGHEEREAGFRAYLEAHHPRLQLPPAIETGEDAGRMRRGMTALLRTRADLVGVYCVGAGRKGVVEALKAARPERRPFIILHDLTETSRAWLVDDLIDVVIDQNARLVGEQAVIRLLGAIATNRPLLDRPADRAAHHPAREHPERALPALTPQMPVSCPWTW